MVGVEGALGGGVGVGGWGEWSLLGVKLKIIRKIHSLIQKTREEMKMATSGS